MNFYWNGNAIQGCPGQGVFWNGQRADRVFWNGVQVLEDSWKATPPTSFNATDTQCEQITFTWTNPTDMGNPPTQFDLYQGTNLVASNVTSGHVETLRQETPVSYHIHSHNACGEEVTNTDNGGSYWEPDSPTGFIASDGACENITFTWTNPVENGHPNCTYSIYEGGTLISSSVSSPAVIALKRSSATDFHVKAVNTCGSNDSNIDAGSSIWKPSTPQSVSASDCGASAVTVTWSASSDAGYPGCTYDVYRNSVLIASSASSPYTDSGASTNTTYSYYVRATNICGYTNSGTTNGSRGRVPTSPSSFAASDNDTSIEGYVRCTWTNSSDAGYPTCTYTVYRDGSVVATNASSGVLINNGSWDGNNTYYVRATNSCGSANSNSDTGSAYQIDPAATTTFTSAGTQVHYTGAGHTKADYCIVGGGGSGGYRPSAGNHAGGGYRGYAASGSNIASTGNVTVYVGPGGAGQNNGGSTGGGNTGGTSSCPWNVAGGGAGGQPNSAAYAGNSGAGASFCGQAARTDGAANGGTDKSWGGQASIGNGGYGGLGGGGGTGGSGAGGGAEVHGATSGAGGAGWIRITTY